MNQETLSIDQLADHLFRRESGKMVAVLTQIFGTENYETAEDVVQDTLLQAVNVWRLKGLPDNPTAWLYTVAKNKAIDYIRKNKHNVRFDFNTGKKALLKSEYTVGPAMEELWREEAVKDDLLGLMFACCHPELPRESQIAFALKSIGGFSTAEIANAFLVGEEAMAKRIYRTREFFRQRKIKLVIPSAQELPARLDGVLNCIYLIFSEGYQSSRGEGHIRHELMGEALALGHLLTENAATETPAALALMALMCFHAARVPGRLNAEGDIVLLPEQDRSTWDREFIEQGNEYLGRSAGGEEMSPYHLEAAIAYEHCAAPSFAETHWGRIRQYYEWLLLLTPSPVIALHKAVATWQLEGAQAALDEIALISETHSLRLYAWFHSLQAELWSQVQEPAKALEHWEQALRLTHSAAGQKSIREKIEMLSAKG